MSLLLVICKIIIIFLKQKKYMNSSCAWLFAVSPSQHQMVKSLHSSYVHRILEETEESKQDRKSTNCMLKKVVVSCEVSLVRCTSHTCAPQILPIPKLRAVFNCFHQFPSVCMFHVDKPMLMTWENGESHRLIALVFIMNSSNLSL